MRCEIPDEQAAPLGSFGMAPSGAVIFIHRNTSVYINRNEVDTEIRNEYSSISALYTVDVFLNYIIVYLQPS